MGHKGRQKKSNSYLDLQQRLDKAPQGAPPSKALFDILKILFTEEEAKLVSVLPINFVTAKKAAKIWKKTPEEALEILDTMADKGLMFDGCQEDDERTYILAPPMAGFFEFSMMRIRDDIDQKVLSEFFFQYLNVEEDFIKALFTNGETQLGRTLSYETPNQYNREKINNIIFKELVKGIFNEESRIYFN